MLWGLGSGQTRAIEPILKDLNVLVPNDFLGVHIGRYWYDDTYLITTGPNTGLRYTPPNITWRYDWVRNHDNAPSWAELHTGPGTYNAAMVARLDGLINYAYANGKKVCYTIFQTPAWVATTLNYSDPYGVLYGANPPNDLTVSGSPNLAEFVTFLVSRYNTGVRKIHAIEAWNEPRIPPLANNDFFSGTAVEMARMAKTVYTAAKAADPGIIVLSPSHTNAVSFISQYLSALVGDGTTGATWQDAIAIHWYNALTFANKYSTDLIKDGVRGVIKGYQDAIATFGIPANKLWDTECGWALAEYTSWSLPQKARSIKTAGLIRAALGVQTCIYYSAGNNYYLTDGTVNSAYPNINLYGGPLSNPLLAEALDWVANLAGKTITEIGFAADGGLYGKTNQGIVFS